MVQDAKTMAVQEEGSEDEGSEEDAQVLEDAQGTAEDEGSGKQNEAIVKELGAQKLALEQELKEARSQVSGVQKSEYQQRMKAAQLEATLAALQEAGSREYDDPDEMRQAMGQAAQQAPAMQAAAEGLRTRYIAGKIRDELEGNWALYPELEPLLTAPEIDARVAMIKARSQTGDSKLLTELEALKKQVADLRDGTHETQPFDGGRRQVSGTDLATQLDRLNNDFNRGDVDFETYKKESSKITKRMKL